MDYKKESIFQPAVNYTVIDNKHYIFWRVRKYTHDPVAQLAILFALWTVLLIKT